MKAENYQDESIVINGTPVTIVTYKIGEEYYCHISNADPGATIARSSGSTLEEARDKALRKANDRLVKVS